MFCLVWSLITSINEINESMNQFFHFCAHLFRREMQGGTVRKERYVSSSCIAKVLYL